MNIAICDDSQMELAYIAQIVYKSFNKSSIFVDLKTYTDAGSLLGANQMQRFDVIFLDLDMPDMNGMEVASCLNQLNGSTEIIFVTNHDELVYKSYRFKALGFIRKKLIEVEIDEIIETLVESINMRCQYITFQDSGNEMKYYVKDIIFLQSDDHYVDIVSADKKDMVRKSLNHIEKDYGHYGFIRIHSRYLVNYRHIYSIEKNAVVLDNQQRLPMSRSRVLAVKEAFQLFSRRW